MVELSTRFVIDFQSHIVNNEVMDRKEEAMNNIAKQRKEIGVSQAALASAIGWGQSRIANYELNIRTPSLSDCRSIVEGLKKLGCKCSLDDVFPPSESKSA